MANQNDDTNTSNRGFASMDPDRQREIASQGGKAAHESGNAHEFTSEEAREAGSRSHINDNNSGGRGRGRSRDDDDDDDDRECVTPSAPNRYPGNIYSIFDKILE